MEFNEIEWSEVQLRRGALRGHNPLIHQLNEPHELRCIHFIHFALFIAFHELIEFALFSS